MALSGTLSGVYRGWTYKIEWTATQSIANNTSTITCVHKLVCGSSYSLSIGSRSNSCTVGGTTKSFTSSAISTGGGTTHTLGTTTHTVTHNSDGTKSVSVSGSFNIQATLSGVYVGSIQASGTITLNTIPRASSLTVSNGTLGTAQTLTITRADSSFKHKITYTCGTASGYAAGSSSTFTTATNISWTPPLSLASQNTTGTSVSITLYLKTYTSDGTQIGESVTKKITCSIPSSVKPTCTISVTDPTEYSDKYGNPVKGLSKFRVVVSPELAYGSSIGSYRVQANGATYTTSSFTTDVLKSSGTLTISATVTDKRGRSGTVYANQTVLDYNPPVITKLITVRCDENGLENEQGDHVQVSYSGSVTNLNNLNTASYTLRYKKSSEFIFTEVALDHSSATYSVSGTYTFDADTGSSYDVEFVVTDAHNTTCRATIVSTGFTIMHFNAAGNGIGFGKVSELENAADFGFDARFNGSVQGNVLGLNVLPAIPADSDLNDYMSTGSWSIRSNAIAATITCGGILLGTDTTIPPATACRFEVSSSTGGGINQSSWSYLRQRFIPYDADYPIWERDIARSDNNVWTYDDWWKSSLTPAAAQKVYHNQKLLWGGDRTVGYYMTEGHTANLTEPISAQPNGIVLVFCAYNSESDTNWGLQSFFVPKYLIGLTSNVHTFTLSRGNFAYAGTKYLYINDSYITGHADNILTGTASGITYTNNKFVLRYVIGV